MKDPGRYAQSVVKADCASPNAYTMVSHDVVEAHCYFIGIGRTDREQTLSRINNN